MVRYFSVAGGAIEPIEVMHLEMSKTGAGEEEGMDSEAKKTS